MGYSFSRIKAGDWLNIVGNYASRYIYVVSINEYANIFKVRTREGGKFTKIEFEALSRKDWNFHTGPHIDFKMNKAYTEDIQTLSREAIRSIFTYQEYFLKNSKSWGN